MGNERSGPSERAIARRLRQFDARYFARPGVNLLAGVDEVGRGALAGPVVAAAVVVDSANWFPGVNDSKQVREGRRETLCQIILAEARGVGIGWASAEEIDQLNIYQATLLAGRRALSVLPIKPDLILTDALKMENLDAPVESLTKGDARSQAIAAASIVAKVTRDDWMRNLDAEYPGYGFAAHKGYGVESHLEALRRLNASTIHRHSFRGVDWFDERYRASRTLTRILGDIAQGAFQAAEIEETWLSRNHLLPESEGRSYHEALRLRGAAGAGNTS